jgi:hypothetical protein
MGSKSNWNQCQGDFPYWTGLPSSVAMNSHKLFITSGIVPLSCGYDAAQTEPERFDKFFKGTPNPSGIDEQDDYEESQ